LIQVRIETVLLEATTHDNGSRVAVVILLLLLLRNEDGIRAVARNPIGHAIVRVKCLANVILVTFQLLLSVARSLGAKAAFVRVAVTPTNIPILIQVRIETVLLEGMTHDNGSRVVVVIILLLLLRNDDGIGAVARNPIGINNLLIIHQHAAAVVRLTLPTRIHNAVPPRGSIETTHVMFAKHSAIPLSHASRHVDIGTHVFQKTDVEDIHGDTKNISIAPARVGSGDVVHVEIGHDVLARGVGEAIRIQLGYARAVLGFLLEAAVVSVTLAHARRATLGGAEGTFRAGLENVLG